MSDDHKTAEQLAEDAVALTARAMSREKNEKGYIAGAELGRAMMKILLENIHSFERHAAKISL